MTIIAIPKNNQIYYRVKTVICITILSLIFIRCSDDGIKPPSNIDPFSGCDNNVQIDSEDSLESNWPGPKVSVTSLSVNPINGWWTGIYTTYNDPENNGVFIYDPVNDIPIASYPFSWANSWSMDGQHLLMIKQAKVLVVDIPDLDEHVLANDGIIDWASWFHNDSAVLYSQINKIPSGMYVVDISGANNQWLISYQSATALDSISMILVENHNLIIKNTADSSSRHIYLPEMDLRHYPNLISVDKQSQYILFESHDDGDALNPKPNGVWLMDTETWTPRKILDGQSWDHTYYPTWATDHSFFASIYCRNDSSTMVWEFDLNGNPIRQVTTKHMNLWIE